MTVCPVCAGRTRDGLMCTPCWNALRRDLRTVPSLLADLDTAAAKQARLTPPTPGGLASERNPVGWHATLTANTLTARLIHWARTVTHQPAHYAITAALRLLTDPNTVRAHPAASELHADITHHIHQARRAIDRPEHRAIIDVGDCPNDDCPGHLRAYIPHDDTPARVTCTTNPDHQWTADQWLRLGRRILATKDSA